LLQRKITPRALNGSLAYFRVYHVFGDVWICWWNCRTDEYRRVADGELDEAFLERLRSISRRVAWVTGMDFFSSEIAVDESNEFIVIDYVNDQCHMLTQSASPKMGVPDELVARIAARLVLAVKGMIRK
jgi:hypothetical protein